VAPTKVLCAAAATVVALVSALVTVRVFAHMLAMRGLDEW
jgi:hypothetical protein